MVLLFTVSTVTAETPAVRIKDLGKVQMGEEIPLTGVGLVIGLEESVELRTRELRERTLQLQEEMLVEL